MVQVNYDIRPIDTEVVVYIRNRIRVYSIMILFGVLLYLNIAPILEQVNASWIHLLHIVFQPFTVFVSLADSSMLAYAIFIMSIMSLFLDSSIFILNFIASRRCLDEPTAVCGDRLVVSGTWLALSGWICLFDVLLLLQTYQFKHQMERKDKQENKTRQKIKSGEETPTWNSIEVYTNKMKVIAIFLFLFDVSQFLILFPIYGGNTMFFLSMVHVLVDPFILLTVRKTNDQVTLNIIRVVFFISLLINGFVLILLLQKQITDVFPMLSLLITITYVITDMVQILYSSIVINTIENYKKYKSKT